MITSNATLCHLSEHGWIHLRAASDLADFRDFTASLGIIVGEEVIALRPGAHAYVAKPGPVPLHTDHPEASIIGWLCQQQDEGDGASMLLDAKPVVEALPRDLRTQLREVELWCPRLAGGPPVLRFPVLEHLGDRDHVFCSPWLQSASGTAEHQRALDEFRVRLSASAKLDAFEVRMKPGDILLVDNRRVLHGRRAIAEGSKRRLHRIWIRSGSADEGVTAWDAAVHRPEAVVG